MKIIGLILLAVGLAILVFVLYILFFQGKDISSPVPDQKGVKVIYITPGAR